MQCAVFPEFICGQSVKGQTCKDLLVRQCLDDCGIIAIIHGKFFNFFGECSRLCTVMRVFFLSK